MMNYFMLLKMLHCRRAHRKKKKRSSNDNTETEAGSSAIKVENTVSEPQICRICLHEGTIPIFGTNGSEDLAEAVITFGGIEVDANDEHPKFLCLSCYDLLQSAISFRKTARQSDERLRQQGESTSEPMDIEKFSDSDSTGLDNDNTKNLEITIERQEVKESKKEEGYKCKKCNIDFKTIEEYAEHRVSQEHENKRIVCQVCNKSYTSLYYKRHMSLHKPDKLYVCDVCGKEFVIQGQFTRHRLTHFYSLPFKCSLCPYRGRFSESLKMHMRSHTGEKPYQCTSCPSRFVSKSNLNKHMVTHNDHDFKCEHCGRGFYTKRNLELHFKVDHTGVKDHICNICGKAFGYRKQMMKHQLKVHKREKLKSGRLPLYLQVESMESQADK